MNYRKMGRTGLKLSELSLGTWITIGEQLSEIEAINLIHMAYQYGINFFDTADEYSNGVAELILGKATKSFQRESFVISTKVWAQTMPGPNGKGLSRKHIFESCNNSLRRLGTDYIDIYFCHGYDSETPVDETIRAMDDLIHQGKVLYWGTSNWEISQYINAHTYSINNNLYTPTVVQPKYNMFFRKEVEEELLPNVKDYGFGLVTYSPLDNGVLSGKYLNKIPEGTRLEYRNWLSDDILDKEKSEKTNKLNVICKELEVSLSQLAIAWNLRIPEISSVILGVSKKSQLEENIIAMSVAEKMSQSVLESIEIVFMSA